MPFTILKRLRQARAELHRIYQNSLTDRDTFATQQEVLEACRQMLVVQQEMLAAVQGQVAEAQARQAQAAVPATWVPPGHHYSPIVDLAELDRRRARVFDRRRRPADIDLRDTEQLAFLDRLKVHYGKLPFGPERTGGLRYAYENGAYSYGDGIVLACTLMELRPRRIVEFGSGHSSCLILDVNERFFDGALDCTFVEPYPDLLYSLIKPEDRARISVVTSPAQDIDLGLIDRLEAGDVLFIDSTHVAKAGSDVNFHMFEVLPRLKPGVFIHIHDVFYPFEYPEDWFFKENRSWTELYVLRAFLTHNDRYRIVFLNDFMHREHRAAVERALPLFSRNPGGALWLQKV